LDLKNLKILGITLARGGSKSVPKKNIKPINEIPLIAFTINEALKSKYISKYIVSTDDEEIKNEALRFDADVPFIRPKSLSSDSATSVDALKHAVNYMENKEGVTYDYVVELMCTNPLKNVDDIDSCIEKLIKTGADSVIAVHQLEDHHPMRIKKIINDKITDFCLKEKLEARRQDLKPNAYVRSGSIYALNRDELMVNNRRYGSKNSRPYILPPQRAVNVDTEIDFLIAEQLMNKEKN
tara:strand:+ start:44 stop:760 length:717 start_codon:yes stop_codon:yes gene_type:complete